MVLMIIYKFYEVIVYVDDVMVLCKGCLVGSVRVFEMMLDVLVYWMMGYVCVEKMQVQWFVVLVDVCFGFEVKELIVNNDCGVVVVWGFLLQVKCGEIVGLVGIFGNGQKELVEVLLGQCCYLLGEICIEDVFYVVMCEEM